MKVADLGSVEVTIRILRHSDPAVEQNVIKVIHWIDTAWLFLQYRVLTFCEYLGYSWHLLFFIFISAT